MKIFILLGIIFANTTALVLVYQFIKKLTKMDKLIFITICFATAYALVSIIYWISGFGIDEAVNKAAKTFITYVFVPVNIILLAPFAATKYSKWRINEIEKNDFIKRLSIIGIVAIIILTAECFYFRRIKKNVIEMMKNIELPELNEEKNTVRNEISVNITNVEVLNEITNEIFINKENKILNQNELKYNGE